MVTNTANDLFPHTGAWNMVLNAQGHIQGDLTVWRGGEERSPQRRKTETRKRAEDAADPLLGTPFAGESGREVPASISFPAHSVRKAACPPEPLHHHG